MEKKIISGQDSKVLILTTHQCTVEQAKHPLSISDTIQNNKVQYSPQLKAYQVMHYLLPENSSPATKKCFMSKNIIINTYLYNCIYHQYYPNVLHLKDAKKKKIIGHCSKKLVLLLVHQQNLAGLEFLEDLCH